MPKSFTKPVIGSAPTNGKIPLTGITDGSFVSESVTFKPTTLLSSESTSAGFFLKWKTILSAANALSEIILSALKTSLLITTCTLSTMVERYVASSIAELPPPITATSLPR